MCVPESAQTIAADAFDKALKLVKLSCIPTALTKDIATKVTVDIEGKKVAIIPEGVEEITEGCFYDTDIEEVYIPRSVTKTGEGKYDSNNEKWISYGAFHGCKKLQKVVFADGSKLKELGGYSFFLCESLKTISLPASLGRIGMFCFQ